MKRARDSPPRLTDAVMAKAINGMLTRGLLRLLARRIGTRQEALRRLCSDEAWCAYLRVEEASNERLSAALVRAARWGHRFAAGARPSARRRVG
jgi:hypothetical protein